MGVKKPLISWSMSSQDLDQMLKDGKSKKQKISTLSSRLLQMFVQKAFGASL